MDTSLYQSVIAGGSKNQIKPAPHAEPKTPDEIKAKRAADEFEAIFISQMLKSMSIGVKTDGPFGGGQSEEIYRELMNEQMGKTISRQGGIGMSDEIYREILKSQEVGK
ncbi:MAG: rod-binding protein [Alphaproteobacteria bacterium]|nr:rod-binding protein [Alphaproteobacteria bacterium]HRW30465.1 rod-binding protein [Emcibacteraceae bacterium]